MNITMMSTNSAYPGSLAFAINVVAPAAIHHRLAVHTLMVPLAVPLELIEEKRPPLETNSLYNISNNYNNKRDNPRMYSD
jgi:hypothetical protein